MSAAINRPHVQIPEGNPKSRDFDWQAVEPVAPLVSSVTTDDMPRTQVRAVASDKALFVRFDCSFDDPSQIVASPPYAPLDSSEYTSLSVHPTCDPGIAYIFRGDWRGMTDANVVRTAVGEASLGEVHDTWSDKSAIKGEWRRMHGLHRDHWWIEYKIPWRTLGLAGKPATLGIQLRHVFLRESLPYRHGVLAWPAHDASDPLTIGDASIGDAGAPESIDLGDPGFGSNTATVKLGDLNATKLIARTEAGESETNITGDTAQVEYILDRNLDRRLDKFAGQRVTIELADDSRTLYTATVPMGRYVGIKVADDDGGLPKLTRRDTNDGAPSDFCLCHEDGSVAANLMANDAWDQLAAIITERFDSLEDRLVAAMKLVGQKAVTNLILLPYFEDAAGRHTYHTALHHVFGPMSIIRYGGGTATARAHVLARLVRAIDGSLQTRVVCLGENGGPRQMDRSFEGSKNLAPFDQHPGPVAAVAVDYEGGQVLLDPTNAIDFDLKPVETIVSDADLRARCAGGLADVFAKLDIDEMRRHQPNRLASRGVYPELAPEEEGEETPFDLGYAHDNPAVIAGKPFSDFMDGVRDAAVTVTHDASGLHVKVAVRGVDPSALDERDRKFERVHIAIDRDHGHANFFRFMQTLEGKRHAARESGAGLQKLAKHYVTEHWTEDAPVDADDWSCKIETCGDGYDATFDISWAALNCDGRADVGPTVGFNVWIDSRYPHYEQIFLSPPQWMLPASPFAFGDLYLDEPAVTVSRVDYGVLCWGDNIATATLHNQTDAEQTVTLQSTLDNGMDRTPHDGKPTTVTVPAGGAVEAEFAWFADPRHKMTTGTYQVSTLHVTNDGGDIFRGAITYHYAATPSVYYRYGDAVKPCDNPQPGDADFIDKKVQHIISSLPDFERVTTRDGAASDFVIRAKDGSVEFNLMKEGTLYRMAEYVQEKFDNDVDRILGLFFLGHHPAVLRHMSFGHRLMNGASPLSVMRGNFAGGGGNCGFHSRAFAGMLAHMTLGGEPLVGHTLGIFGHSVNAFGWNGSKVIIDNDVGHFMLLPDGSDFATIDHFGRDLNLLTTAGPVDIARYFTFNRDSLPKQETIMNIEWPGSFPPGAPKD